MPQAEGSTEYTYEDYASKLAVNRLPQSGALVDTTLSITLDSGAAFELAFVSRNRVAWRSGAESGTDWCEVVEVAPQTFFIDLTFTHQPRQTQTFIANLHTRQALGIRTIMRQGEVGKEPRAVHEFSPGVLGDPALPPWGRKPGPTRDLIGFGYTELIESFYLAQREISTPKPHSDAVKAMGPKVAAVKLPPGYSTRYLGRAQFLAEARAKKLPLFVETWAAW